MTLAPDAVRMMAAIAASARRIRRKGEEAFALLPEEALSMQAKV